MKEFPWLLKAKFKKILLLDKQNLKNYFGIQELGNLVLFLKW